MESNSLNPPTSLRRIHSIGQLATVRGVLVPRPAGVGERARRRTVSPDEQLGGVPDELVVLGEVAHRVEPGLVDPVLEAEQRRPSPGRAARRPSASTGRRCQQVHQPDGLEVGAVAARVDHRQRRLEVGGSTRAVAGSRACAGQRAGARRGAPRRRAPAARAATIVGSSPAGTVRVPAGSAATGSVRGHRAARRRRRGRDQRDLAGREHRRGASHLRRRPVGAQPAATPSPSASTSGHRLAASRPTAQPSAQRRSGPAEPVRRRPVAARPSARRRRASSTCSATAAACSSAPGEGMTTRTGSPSTRSDSTWRHLAEGDLPGGRARRGWRRRAGGRGPA